MSEVGVTRSRCENQKIERQLLAVIEDNYTPLQIE
jgi:hypothetical protein